MENHPHPWQALNSSLMAARAGGRRGVHRMGGVKSLIEPRLCP